MCLNTQVRGPVFRDPGGCAPAKFVLADVAVQESAVHDTASAVQPEKHEERHRDDHAGRSSALQSMGAAGLSAWAGSTGPHVEEQAGAQLHLHSYRLGRRQRVRCKS